ncbi:MAG: hypothetical protein LBS03_02800, partial [Bacteroidales bacterium]|nr:hypothetical protein [Bacteroidales bacterium]
MKKLVSLLVFLSLLLCTCKGEEKTDEYIPTINLLAPHENDAFNLDEVTEISFSWATEGITAFKLLLSLTEDLASPQTNFASNSNYAKDLTADELDVQLTALGVSNGEAATVYWSVQPAGSLINAETQVRSIRITRKSAPPPTIALSSPADNAFFDLTLTEQVRFSWASDANTGYILLLDKASDLSDPHAIPVSAKSVDVPASDLDDLLAAWGIGLSEPSFVYWAVVAADAAQSKPKNVNRIKFIRKSGENETPWVTGNEKIPVLAWLSIPHLDSWMPGGAPWSDAAIQAHYQTFKEAGFTYSLSFRTDDDYLERVLNAGQATGVKIIANYFNLLHPFDVSSDAAITTSVNRFKNHPALGGYYLRDEPPLSIFSMLGNKVRLIEDLDPNPEHFCYINVAGALVADPSFHGASGDYLENYLTPFVNATSPKFMAFNTYPITVENLDPENKHAGYRLLYKGWYGILDLFLEKSNQSGLPFWTFAVSSAHQSYPAPITSDLRLQIYTSLAYGSQGIQYFTYWSQGSGFYAMVSQWGDKTTVYNVVKEMNEEMQNYAAVFLGASVVWVKHTGEENFVPGRTVMLEPGQLPTQIKTLETGDAGTVVSLLEKGNRMFLVVVSRDANESQEIQIETTSSVREITKRKTLRTVTGLKTETL